MNHIQAFGSGVEMRERGALPTDIQWMPPGEHTITTRGEDGEPKTRTLRVDARLAERVQQMFAAVLARGKAGEGDLPYIDFNHDDGEAAGHPSELYWAGEDPKLGGIRAKLTWTSAGKEAIAGRTFRRFSPEFYVDNHDQVAALGPNLGGLVNRAAFTRIQPIWSRGVAGPSTQQPNTNNMTEAQAKQLADLTTAVAGLTTIVNSIKAKQDEQPAPGTQAVKAGAVDDTKVLVLETKVATLEEARKVDAKREAERVVAKAIEDGRIPPQNKELADRWVVLIQVDAKNADLIPAANPALGRVTPPNGATAGAAMGGAGDHAFVVKAREYATAQKITDASQAQADFARTPEGRQLYGEYLQVMKGGK